ncbi:MAG: hypothetical protein ACJ8GN_24165, partial [Longimicrobiaceae bacterium]
TAQQLVQRHLTALGGEARLRAAKTFQSTALKQGADGESASVSTYRARPNLVRWEFQKDGVPQVKAFDGKQAWMMEGSEAKALPAEKSKMMAEAALFDDVLLDPAKRGVKLSVAGVEDVKGAPAYKLVLTHGQDVETRYLDQKTMLEVKRVAKGMHEGKAYEKTVYFSDPRPVDGIMVNHVSEWEVDGERGRSVVESARFDAAVDPALFQLPRNRS